LISSPEASTTPVAAPPRSCVDGQMETCVTPTAPSDTQSSAIIGTICGVNAATMSATALTTKPAIANGTRAVHTEPLRGLAGRVRDHVQLHGVHQRHLNRLLMRLLGKAGTL